MFDVDVEPPPKRHRRAQKSPQADQINEREHAADLSRERAEKAKLVEELEETRDNYQIQINFTDQLQTKLEEMSKLALAHGAQISQVNKIKQLWGHRHHSFDYALPHMMFYTTPNSANVMCVHWTRITWKENKDRLTEPSEISDKQKVQNTRNYQWISTDEAFEAHMQGKLSNLDLDTGFSLPHRVWTN